jgi:hypothetical protein
MVGAIELLNALFFHVFKVRMCLTRNSSCESFENECVIETLYNLEKVLPEITRSCMKTEDKLNHQLMVQ